MTVEDDEKLPLLGMTAKQKREKKEISTFFKIFLTTWAFVENGLFSGLRAGWTALVYVLKQENIYANLCSINITGNVTTEPTTITAGGVVGSSSPIYQTSTQNSTNLGDICDEQDAIFNQCFTVASATMSLSALMYGQLNYKFGIRVPRLLSVILFVGGTCCFAFVNKDIPWLIFPGLLLVSSGGMALYITNNQISYMFTTRGAAVVGLLCGSLEASAMVLSVIKMVYQNGISLFISFLTLGGLYLLTLFSTLCFLPKDYVNAEAIINSSENVSSEDVESAKDQENVPIIENDLSINKTIFGDKDGFISATGSDLLQVDLNDNPQTTENEAGMSNDESQNNIITQSVSDRTNEYTSQNDHTEINTLDENEHFYEEDGMFSINGDILQNQHEILQRDLQVTIQDTSTRNKTASRKNTSETNIKDKDEKTAKVSHSINRASGSSEQKKVLKYILTKTFMLYLFWAVAVQIILSLSLGTFNSWLNYVTDKKQSEVSDFTDILFYSMLGSPLLALLFGLAMDFLKHIRSENTPPEVLTLRTATVSLAVTSILGVILSGLFMTCRYDVVVITCIFLVLFRTGLYSCGTAFLRIMYPTNYFGVLCGIMTVLAGGISYIQYPLFLWVQSRDRGWTEVYGFLCVIGLVSLVQPAYLQWKSRQYRNSSYSTKRNSI